LACICDVHNEGNTPNFGERTGKLIGIDGGNIRLGGCLILLNKLNNKSFLKHYIINLTYKVLSCLASL